MSRAPLVAQRSSLDVGREGRACSLPPGPAGIRFHADKWPPTVTYHEGDYDSSSDEDDEGDGTLSERRSIVGAHVHKLTVETSDGSSTCVDCKDMTGDQLQMLLSADSHETRTLHMIVEPEVVHPSKAMRRVSHKKKELEPNLSNHRVGQLQSAAEDSYEHRSGTVSFLCVDWHLPSWLACTGCSFLQSAASPSAQAEDPGDALPVLRGGETAVPAELYL